MDMTETTLAGLSPGARAEVTRLTTAGALRRRLLDIGLTPGTAAEALYRSRNGGIAAYRIRGAVFALRREDAGTVLVRISGDGGEAAWA